LVTSRYHYFFARGKLDIAAMRDAARRLVGEMQPRCSRETAERQPRDSREAAERQPRVQPR